MFYKMIENKCKEWYNSEQCTVHNLIEYIEKTGQMRDAQIEAIKVYLFLKIGCECKPLEFLFISAIEVEKAGTIFSESKGAFACRVLMAKIISGASSKEELLEWCVGYSKKETNERIALAECIEQFIVQVLSTDQIDATVLSIVMQCFDDEHCVVRRKSCNCFVLLLDTKYRDLAERKLCEAAIDPSHYVRSQVLNLCKSEKIKIPEIKNELIGILATDANYAIRIGCE